MAIYYMSTNGPIRMELDHTGTADVTDIIQTALDGVINGGTIILDSGDYKVSKNSDLPDFPNHDQPALLLRNKERVRISGHGARLFVDKHAQGVLELQNCSASIIEGLELEGCGTFPSLDTASAGYTGYGEKGTANGGYHTSGFWGYRKNNSFDTSGNTRHGQGGQPWGTFGGGYIGNVSFGLLIHRGCENITVRDLDVHGFNYVGIGVGFNGDYVPTNLGYPDSRNILIGNCYVHDNYDANIHTMACDGVKVVHCTLESAGHPDASINHNFVDPGYGMTLRGTNWCEAKNSLVDGCTFRQNKRKGIDCHSGIGMIFTNNTIEHSFVNGIFVKWVSDLQQSKEIIITNNLIKHCATMLTAGGSISVGGARGSSFEKGNANVNVIVSNNVLKDTAGAGAIMEIGPFEQAIVEGNILDGVSPLAQDTSFYGILLGRSSNEKSAMLNLSNNLIDAKGHPGLVRGIQVQNVNEGTVSNNVIKLEHNCANIGLYSIGNGYVNFSGNYVKLGTIGTPLAITQTKGTTIGNIGLGGNATYNYHSGQIIHFRITVNKGNGTVNHYTGSQFVSSLETNMFGFTIFLKNVPQNLTPFVTVANASADGLLAPNGSAVGYIYTRESSSNAITVGLKCPVKGSHIALSNIISGALDVMVTL